LCKLPDCEVMYDAPVTEIADQPAICLTGGPRYSETCDIRRLTTVSLRLTTLGSGDDRQRTVLAISCAEAC